MSDIPPISEHSLILMIGSTTKDGGDIVFSVNKGNESQFMAVFDPTTVDHLIKYLNLLKVDKDNVYAVRVGLVPSPVGEVDPQLYLTGFDIIKLEKSAFPVTFPESPTPLGPTKGKLLQ